MTGECRASGTRGVRVTSVYSPKGPLSSNYNSCPSGEFTLLHHTIARRLTREFFHILRPFADRDSCLYIPRTWARYDAVRIVGGPHGGIGSRVVEHLAAYLVVHERAVKLLVNVLAGELLGGCAVPLGVPVSLVIAKAVLEIPSPSTEATKSSKDDREQDEAQDHSEHVRHGSSLHIISDIRGLRYVGLRTTAFGWAVTGALPMAAGYRPVSPPVNVKPHSSSYPTLRAGIMIPARNRFRPP